MRYTQLIVRGRVQGVFFREFVWRKARELGLRGWVRNRPDGTLEIVVAGQEEKIEALAAACRRGPLLAKVEAVERGVVEEREWDDFFIRY